MGRVPDAVGLAFAALRELPEAAAVLDPVRDEAGEVVDFVVAYLNLVAAEALGADPDEMTGRSVLESLPDFPAQLLHGFAAVLEESEPLRTRLGFRGARFEISASRIADRVLVVYEDITARDRAAAAEERFRAVIEATSDWVSIADADERLVFVNSGGRRMIGIGPDESIEGTRVGQFSPPWARERVLTEALPAARREGVWRGDLARLHRDGHEIPVSQVIVAGRDDDGEIEFYATIARDMTRERAAEEALRATEERFRITFEQGPVGVSLLDLEGNFVQVNDAFCRTVRRSREELMALGPVAITHPDDVAYTRYAMRSLLIGEVPLFRFEKRYLAPDGDIIWAELSGTVIRDSQDRPQFLVGMLMDIGDRRVASTLQRSMLTTQLPEIETVELAVRYLPSGSDAEVSGDWYDVIPLPDGRVGVVIGDVVGRGVDAAATMSQLRTALRAYAVEGLEPAEVVAKLHRLVDHLRFGLSTTLTYLDLDPFTLEVRYVSAGHLPILLAPAGGSPRFLEGARSTPLGAAAGRLAVPQERVVLAPGDGLLLYTDGLVERRDAGIDSRLEALRSAMEDVPSDLGDQLVQLTTTLAGSDMRSDDIALLALRAHGPPPGSFATEMRAAASELGALRDALRAWLAEFGATDREIGDVLVAAGEACSNAIEHSGAATDATIRIRARVSDGELLVTIADRGTWRAARAPADRGHGMRLMRMLMDTVRISATHVGTIIELRFGLGDAGVARADRPPPPASPGLRIERVEDVPVARVVGEIDLARVGELSVQLIAAAGPRDRGLVLDLSAVEYLDSTGVHLLHALVRRLEEFGQRLRVVVAPGAPVARVLEFIDLRNTVAIDPSVQEAVAALTPPGPWG
ncbi:MAG TPA: SpoIIE family protein phosphatase [Solirubrobacteraceae bacterium]|nr:SpoIIE family protein phosphatase [Solirubrobacteraceae bacterium]